MSSTVVVRGDGGAIFEMDVPVAGPALARWDEQIAKGELVVVTDDVEWVDAGDGANRLQVVEKAAAKPRAKAAAKDKPTDDTEE